MSVRDGCEEGRGEGRTYADLRTRDGPQSVGGRDGLHGRRVTLEEVTSWARSRPEGGLRSRVGQGLNVVGTVGDVLGIDHLGGVRG